MTTKRTKPQVDSYPEPPVRAQPRGNPYAEVVTLALSSATHAQYMTHVLRFVTRMLNSPYATMHVRYTSEVLQDDFHTGPTDPNFWKPSLQSFLTDALGKRCPRARLLKAKGGDAHVAFISAAIYDRSGSSIGAIALVLAPFHENELHEKLAMIEAITSLASACGEIVGHRPDAAEDQGGRVGGKRGQSAALAKAAGVSSADELAFTLTNEIRSKLGCEQVAVGLVDRNCVRILAISGLDQVNRRSPGVLAITAAMEECLDQNKTLVCRGSGAWVEGVDESDFRLHKQWHAAANGDAVASIPLCDGEIPVAILSVRSRSDHGLTRAQLDAVRGLVQPFGPALVVARRAGRGLVRHAVDSVREAGHTLTSPGHLGRKILTVVFAAAVLGFVFGTWPYRVTVPCVVTPAHLRHVTAPFDGILASASVVEGDVVSAGQVLCAFDRRELEGRIAEILAGIEVLEREKDRAVAEDDRVGVQLALAKQEELRATLKIVQARAQRATVSAPIDGVVVFGDLRKHIGSAVSRGDPLFVVAPPEQWTIELEMPEFAAAELGSGLHGVFMSHAKPDEVSGFQITRVHPSATLRDNRNVFVAEANVSESGRHLRPGMEGIAKVEFGPRRISWLMTHRLLDYLRIKFWL